MPDVDPVVCCTKALRDMDVDGSGAVSFKEFFDWVRSWCRRIARVHVRALVTTGTCMHGRAAHTNLLSPLLVVRGWQSLAQQGGTAHHPDTVEGLTDDLFSILDADKSGAITHVEFTNALNSLGQGLSPADILSIIKEIDTDNDGEIEKDEFAALIRRHMAAGQL